MSARNQPLRCHDHFKHLVLTLATALAPAAFAQPAAPTIPPIAELTRIVKDLDRQHFDAYNTCDLKKLESLYAPGAEFHYDMHNRVLNGEQLVAAVKKNICGKVQRRLIESSLEVYRMEGSGAIEIGRHCFIPTGKSDCIQEARFFMLWKFDGVNWQLTRVISYDHKNMP